AQIVGADHLAGVDPSEPFVAAARKRVPGADLRVAPAESLPFQDGTFDRAVSQLVFHFVDDPPQAVAEMRRVTREGGRVAAREVDASAPDEIERFGGRPGQVAALWREAGLRDVVDDEIVVAARYRDFGELWAAFLGGVGPIGAHVSSLDDGQRAEVAAALRRRIGSPEGPFELSARA